MGTPCGKGAVSGLNALMEFWNDMNWWKLLDTLLSVAAALLCITVHELSHGLAAYKLGDPTAKNAGRLTLNPIKHIDPFGLLMMVAVHVGWAKPVPVDMRYFKRPKRDMALTALAGPASNFVLALAVGVLFSLLYASREVMTFLLERMGWDGFQLFFQFLVNLVVMNVGLGIFNLFPIPPLDGSKILFSFLPTRIYRTILRYERYVMIALMALLWFGVLDGPLGWLIGQGLHLVGLVTRCPFWG